MSFFEERDESKKVEDKSVEEVVDLLENEKDSKKSVSYESEEIALRALIPFEKNRSQIDTLYKQGIIEYTESIHRYNIEIEKLKYKVESAKNIKEENSLLVLEGILEHESKLFEGMQHKITQKILSLVELRDEYKESLEEGMYKEKLFQKERELFVCIDEIEEKEISLLNRELEKINLSEILAKKLKRLEELICSLKELELEKSYFESTGLNQVSSFKLGYNPKEKTMIVDTVVMDEEK